MDNIHNMSTTGSAFSHPWIKAFIFNGPYAYSLFSIWFLIKRIPFLVGFLVWFAINSSTNKVLKQWIREPRPNNYQQIHDGGQYTRAEIYGMPSGHSQTIFFVVMYVWMVLQNISLTLTGLFVAALTLYQRWADKKHTISQLAVGCVVGLLMGWASYKITKRAISILHTKKQIMTL